MAGSGLADLHAAAVADGERAAAGQQLEQLGADQLAAPAAQRAHVGLRLRRGGRRRRSARGPRGPRSARRPARPPARGCARATRRARSSGRRPPRSASGRPRRAGSAPPPAALDRLDHVRPRRRTTSGVMPRICASSRRPAGWRLASSTTVGSRRTAPTGRSSSAAVRSPCCACSSAPVASVADRGGGGPPVGSVLRPDRGGLRQAPPAGRRGSPGGSRIPTSCGGAGRPARGDRGASRPRPIASRRPSACRPRPWTGPRSRSPRALVRARAQEAGLAYELIAARADLSPVVVAARRGQPEPDVRTLQGWRRELVGAELLELLAGRRTLGVAPAAGSRSPRPEAASAPRAGAAGNSGRRRESPPVRSSR